MEELYDDREYLEELLDEQDTKLSRKKGGEGKQGEEGAATGGAPTMSRDLQVRDTIVDGLNYLDKRSEFWQQQRPMYARRRDQKRSLDHALAKGTASAEASHQHDPAGYVVRRLEEIDECMLMLYALCFALLWYSPFRVLSFVRATLTNCIIALRFLIHYFLQIELK